MQHEAKLPQKGPYDKAMIYHGGLWQRDELIRQLTFSIAHSSFTITLLVNILTRIN